MLPRTRRVSKAYGQARSRTLRCTSSWQADWISKLTTAEKLMGWLKMIVCFDASDVPIDRRAKGKSPRVKK